MNISNRNIVNNGILPAFIIRWSAVFGGLLGAFVVLFLLNLLSTALGFASLNPSKDSLVTVGGGILVWLAVSSIISSFIGGWISGRFSDSTQPCNGAYHGLLVSGLSLVLLIFLFTTTIGSIVGGSFSILGKTLNIAGSSVSNATSFTIDSIKNLEDFSVEDVKKGTFKTLDSLPDSFKPLVNQVKQDIQDLSKNMSTTINEITPSEEQSKKISDDMKNQVNQVQQRIVPAIIKFVKSINTSDYDVARAELIRVLADNTGKSTVEIEAVVNKWQQQFLTAKENAKQAAVDAAKKTASAMSYFAGVNFIILLLGVLAATLGGYMAVKRINKNMVVA